MFTRIQWRIAVGYVALLGVVLLALGLYVNNLVRAQQLHDLETELGRHAVLIAERAAEQWATGPSGRLDALAKEVGGNIAERVTLIAADGTVLGDSDHDPTTMDNHAGRPEVQQALRGGSGSSRRPSTTLEEDLLYVAVPIVRDGMTLGVARVALPVRQVHAALDRVEIAIIGAFVVAAVLGTLLAIVVARATTRPLADLMESARRIAAGNFATSLRVEGRDEVSALAHAFNDMAVQLRTQMEELEESRSRMEALLAHMADGLVIVDQTEAVQLINPAAVRLLEVSPGDAVVGHSATAVLRDHELVAVVREARRIPPPTSSDGPTTATQPRVVELGSGEQRRAVQAVASPLAGGAELGGRVLLLLQDVTELRRTEAVRREFVANVSHELRTPVAALKALVETLESGALDDPPAARDFLARMHVEVDGLAHLVGELLELSKIEGGRTPLRLQRIKPALVVANAAERLRPQAERQGLVLHVESGSDIPTLQADGDRIQQVVVNLVHNAIKFTPPGGRVDVSIRRHDHEVAVAVADTGCGIPADALPRLFERFYKVDRARSSGDGTGLGLAIAKHLVQAHGGRIWAESEGEGRGATFTFTLPVDSVLQPV
jgi:two-component system phosphate regulon sensor histidine kinase PhoR